MLRYTSLTSLISHMTTGTHLKIGQTHSEYMDSIEDNNDQYMPVLVFDKPSKDGKRRKFTEVTPDNSQQEWSNVLYTPEEHEQFARLALIS